MTVLTADSFLGLRWSCLTVKMVCVPKLVFVTDR